MKCLKKQNPMHYVYWDRLSFELTMLLAKFLICCTFKNDETFKGFEF